MGADLIATHVAALEDVLRGPRRLRRCMISEVRSGLHDAAAAYRDGGLLPDQAAARAVRDFGTVREVAPSFQDELTARQGRLAAVLFALVFPGMMLAWDLLWSSGAVRRAAGPASPVVSVLSSVEDMASVLVAAAASALLAVTFRRTVSAHRLTRAIGLTGAVGALLCGGLAVAMNVAGGRAAVSFVLTNPAAISAFLGSGVVLALIVWQSVRTLAVARAAVSEGRR